MDLTCADFEEKSDCCDLEDRGKLEELALRYFKN